MCNDYRLEVDIATMLEDFERLGIKIGLPEGRPNVAAREDIKISDAAPIVRSGRDASGELVNRRWSWPNPNGAQLYNLKSEGRDFSQSRRCLILTDGWYEFTAPQPGEKRKTKWLFTLNEHTWFCIAGIWRKHAEVGEAFTMLTTEPGNDVAPYHRRSIVPLGRDRMTAWLDHSLPAEELLKQPPKGSLTVMRVFPPAEVEPA